MSFLGLVPWQLATLGAASAGVLVSLYWLRLRRPRHVVTYLPLWLSGGGGQSQAARYGRPRDLLSLLLQLTLLGLLLAALFDPKPSVRAGGALSTVVLLDASVQMQTRLAAGTRFDAALGRAVELVDSMQPGDRTWFIAVSDGPHPLRADATNRESLRGALRGLQPTREPLELTGALRLAADLLAGSAHPRVVLLTGPEVPEPEPPAGLGAAALRLERFGLPVDDVALVAVGVRARPLEPSRRELLVELEHVGSATVQGRLLVESEVGPVYGAPSRLGANVREQWLLRELPAVGGTVKVSFQRTDGSVESLTANDEASVELPPSTRRRVALVTEGNRYLEAALRLDPGLELVVMRPDQADHDPEFSVAILDGVVPVARPKARGYLLLGEGALGDWFPVGRRLELFGFDRVSETSSVTRGLDLSRVQVLDGHALQPGAKDEVLAASEGGPLFVRGEREASRVLALGFDPRRSDFVLRSVWPQFVQRAVDYLSTGDGDGWLVSWRSPRTPGAAAEAGTASAWATLEPPRRVLERRWWQWFAATAGVLLLLEWFSTHRRWTS